MLKTHLIVTDVHEEYFVKWTGNIANTKPLFKNDMPVFVIIGYSTNHFCKKHEAQLCNRKAQL